MAEASSPLTPGGWYPTPSLLPPLVSLNLHAEGHPEHGRVLAQIKVLVLGPGGWGAGWGWGWVLGVRRLSQGRKPVRKRYCGTGHAAGRWKAIGLCCCPT